MPVATQSWLSWRVPDAAALGQLPTSVPEMGGTGAKLQLSGAEYPPEMSSYTSKNETGSNSERKFNKSQLPLSALATTEKDITLYKSEILKETF